MQAACVTKTQDCSFFYGTIVTFLVTVSLQFSCKYKHLKAATKTLPAVKQHWMSFGLLHTRKCWALTILLSVSNFSMPIAKVLNVPFASVSLICKKLMILLSQNFFEVSFVHESLGDPREKIDQIFLQVSLVLVK